MKKVLLTTTAIVGLSAPAFAADPTAVSDQPYFHHSHPMSWSGSMSISLTNPSGSDIDTAITKNGDNICMTVVNKSEKEIVKVLVSNLDRITENYCIRGSNKVDLNDSKNLNKVKIEKNIIKIDKYVINLPPHSVSVFIFKM